MIPLLSLPLSDSLSLYKGNTYGNNMPVVGPLPWLGIVSSEKEDLKSVACNNVSISQRLLSIA